LRGQFGQELRRSEFLSGGRHQIAIHQRRESGTPSPPAAQSMQLLQSSAGDAAAPKNGGTTFETLRHAHNPVKRRALCDLSVAAEGQTTRTTCDSSFIRQNGGNHFGDMAMPSPFPGMDPYLESHWRDVHTVSMTYARDEIQDQLPNDLIARVEEGVTVDEEDGSRSIAPDVRVVEEPWAGSGEGGGVAVAEKIAAEPVRVLVDEQPTPRHIEILDTGGGNRLVTAIEFLSPSNKIPADGRELYLRKQREYLHSAANLVEIDLLRAGYHTVAFDREKLRPEQRTPYVICVRRAAHPWEAEVYPATYREPLPTIRVPLRPTDADVTLNLQSLITQCYDRGRYAATINYARDPDPPLPLVEAQWADRLLREAGVR